MAPIIPKWMTMKLRAFTYTDSQRRTSLIGMILLFLILNWSEGDGNDTDVVVKASVSVSRVNEGSAEWVLLDNKS